MTRRRGLGRGLEALIPGGTEAPGGQDAVRRLPVSELRPNPRQPRRDLSRADLEELAESIREHGVLQPLVVTPATDGDGYLLIAGERRLEAARLIGLETVPVVVRVADERLSLELALVENLQRDDLDPLEAAEGYRQLVEDFGISHEQVAQRVGKSRSSVSNTLRLLRLPASVRQALGSGRLSEGHARALLALPTAQAQSAAAQTVVKRGLSVRQTEDLVQRLTGQRRRTSAVRRRSPEEAAVEEQLRQALGTKVTLRRGRKGGNVIIHFYSEEELEALLERLLGG
jgi:ParB family chromosome partitioning protein